MIDLKDLTLLNDLAQMADTRRGFLKKALGITVGAFAVCIGPQPKAQNETIAVRREIEDLDWQRLRQLQEAVRILRQRSQVFWLDPTGWASNANLHRDFCSGGTDRQVHFGWWFLPWHRAFLAYTERKLQAAVGDRTLGLPYWNWHRNRGGFKTIALNYTGWNNPLSDFTRRGTPQWSIPNDWIDLRQTMATTDFGLFGGERVTPTSPQQPGLLESSAHNSVHSWVGGNMESFATAAFDPSFFGHHANIDRLWDAWMSIPANNNPTAPEWLDREFPMVDPQGNIERIAVRDLLDTESLDYRYEQPPVEILLADQMQPTAPPTPLPADVQREFEAPPQPAEAMEITSRPKTFKLSAPEQRPALASAMGAKPKVVILRIEELVLPAQNVSYRVFINRPDAHQDTAPDPANGFVGTISLVPTGAVVNPPITARLPIPEEVLASLGQTEENNVTIVPVSPRGEPVPDVRVSFKSFSIQIKE